MGFAKKIRVKAVIHCGDWNTLESAETVLSFGIPLYTVLGNADVRPEVSEKLRVESEKFSEDFLEFEIEGRKIGITHKPLDIKKYFGDKKLDITFCGHYHSKDESMLNGVRIIRPGAIINGNNFAVYDTTSDTMEFINNE